MNILIFTAIYPAPAEYGIPNDTKVVHYYAKQWQKIGHRVLVVYLHMIPIKKISIINARKIYGFESNYKYDGIDVHLLEYQLFVPKANYLSSLQANDAEKKIIRFVERSFIPDKLFVHFPCSFRSTKWLSHFSCPTMAVLHNVDIAILKKKPKMVSELENFKNIGGRNKKICDKISFLLGKKSSLILSGIDQYLIAPIEYVYKKISSQSKTLKIVYAGNLIKLKKVDVLIRALERVNFEYSCNIIGDGPEKNKLLSLTSNNQRIIFKGRLEREETIKIMRESDIFVMVSSPETFGLVYLEAMAQGCITIGSKGEGIDGVIIDGENGLLVPPNDVDNLVKCFEKIVKMKLDERQKLIYSAYTSAIKMTDFNMAKKYLQENS